MPKSALKMPENYYQPRRDLDFSGVQVFTSHVSGSGVRALRPFKRGEEIMPLTGVLCYSLTREDLADHMLMQIDDDVWLRGAGNPDDYINHHCAPNLGYNPAGDAYIAMRDILAGEELFFDYVMADRDGEISMACSCGASNCRGVILGFRQLTPAWQAVLLPYALPYIRRSFS